MIKLSYMELRMKYSMTLLFVSVFFISGCVSTQGAENIINYKGIDSKVKQIDITGKIYEQICRETFGIWMSAEDGMKEMRDGKEIGTESCNRCMTDNSNMFCNQDDYLNAIKVE